MLLVLTCSACGFLPASGPSRGPFLLLGRALFSLDRSPCDGPPLADAARLLNRASLYRLRFAPFGRPETGWATYAPAVEQEIDTRCSADTAGFAATLSRWQRRRGLEPSGVLTDQTFRVMKTVWQNRRPFITVRAAGVCPDPPSADRLATVRPEDSYQGRSLQLRPGALAAYRRMAAEARRRKPAIAAHPDLLKIFSAYRSPAYDAARCAKDGDCQGVVRAACSAHRTGLAVDVVLDAAPGYAVDSSADPNRMAMANGVAYRWLVANARRYGFVNYAFEPWHWEWTGQRP